MDFEKGRASVINVLNVIESIYPNWRKDERTIVTWQIALADVPDADIRDGIVRMTREHTSGFAPTPAEFLQYTRDGRSSDLAWHELLTAVRRHGHITSPTFSHDSKIAESVRRLGGWVKICRSTVDELPFVQRDFKAIYDSLSGDYSPHLSGSAGATPIEYDPQRAMLPPPTDKALPQPVDPISERPAKDSKALFFQMIKKSLKNNLTEDQQSQ